MSVAENTNGTIPVSVHMLTFNSGKTIRKALESVKNCREILIIDGGSTDDTLSIAQEYNAIILKQEQASPLKDFSAARNQGLKAATQNWILVLDSDEYLSPDLHKEVEIIVNQNVSPAAYLVPRKYVLDDGTIVEHASTYPNARLYFFHKDATLQWIKPVHERIELKPGTPMKKLRGASLAPIGTLDDFRRKNERYLQIELERSKGKGWGDWFVHKLLRTIRSRLILCTRLVFIWILPKKGKRLPLSHEWIRFIYAWKLVFQSMPF